MEPSAQWIWYPGDFEIFHALKVNCRREERGFQWPAYWRLDDCYHNVQFRKTVSLDKPEKIYVESNGIGYVSVDDKKYKLRTDIFLEAGKHDILLSIAKINGLPCAYVSGKTVVSDKSWEATCLNNNWLPAGTSAVYNTVEPSPEVFQFAYKKIEPISKTQTDGGTVFDFGRETFAELYFQFKESTMQKIPFSYGESLVEALDADNSYIQDEIPAGVPAFSVKPRAFRYIYVRDKGASYTLSGRYQYLPLDKKGNFKCSDDEINKIWETAAYTFHLNSREFFFDGIKRDRWIWSGDAYQSYLTNFYLFFDKDICKRTIIALRGKDPIEQHINTIVDYSFLWILSIYNYYYFTDDTEFLEFIFPKMKSMIEFCLSRTNSEGFADAKKGDWIFIDWSDFDRQGPLCAEQMLLVKSIETMAECAKALGKDGEKYLNMSKELRKKIEKYFWNDELGAYVDSYESGKNHITRHANIFALLFDFGSKENHAKIVKNVILNPKVPPITTPYFQFYELDTMCEIGNYENTLKTIKDYWGGMLNLGVTTFWEEYDPKKEGSQHYEMYGDKYGKSLCHAWGASPIYLLGKYYLGVKPTSPGYKTFEVKPNLGGLKWLEGTVPLNNGEVRINLDTDSITVISTQDGGTLVINDKQYKLDKNKELSIKTK